MATCCGVPHAHVHRTPSSPSSTFKCTSELQISNSRPNAEVQSITIISETSYLIHISDALLIAPTSHNTTFSRSPHLHILLPRCLPILHPERKPLLISTRSRSSFFVAYSRNFSTLSLFVLFLQFLPTYTSRQWWTWWTYFRGMSWVYERCTEIRWSIITVGCVWYSRRCCWRVGVCFGCMCGWCGHSYLALFCGTTGLDVMILWFLSGYDAFQ
jgi:hypothetical protein